MSRAVQWPQAVGQVVASSVPGPAAGLTVSVADRAARRPRPTHLVLLPQGLDAIQVPAVPDAQQLRQGAQAPCDVYANRLVGGGA